MSSFIQNLGEVLQWISYFNTLVFLPTNILVVWRVSSNTAHRIRLLEEQLREH